MEWIKQSVSLSGKRKFILCLVYIGACVFLNYTAITKMETADLMGLGLMDTGLATGVGAIVWGNVMEHRAKAGGV